jgi:hypothetical protein
VRPSPALLDQRGRGGLSVCPGEQSLKTEAAFLVRLPNSPITRTGRGLVNAVSTTPDANYPDPGFVYILTNEAMPGYVKIGLTRGDDIQARLRQLDTTSVPLPFKAFYAARVPDCRKVERRLHFVFGEKRARLGREFFRTEPDIVRAILELVEIREVDTTEANGALGANETEAITQDRLQRARSPSFEELGLMPGTTLTFTKDPDVTCTIVGAKTVSFRGNEISLSGAALQAVREMGYNWSTVRGSDYWAHNGVKLSAMPTIDTAG